MTPQKLDDNRLYESTTLILKDDENWYRESCIRNEFNFLSQQRTTNVEFVLWNKKSNQLSTSVSTTVQNFRDIEGDGEIARAHAQLLCLGGHPPPLEDVLERISKTKLLPKI